MVFLQIKQPLNSVFSVSALFGVKHAAQRHIPFTSRTGNQELFGKVAFSTTASGLTRRRSSRKSKVQPETTGCEEAKAQVHQSHPSHTTGGLNLEQQRIYDMVLNQKESVFFTGPAGTGKSWLLERIVRGLSKKYPEHWHRVAVTASTGLAASNIRGTTLHRFAGIGLGQAPTEKLINDICKDNLKYQRWQKVKVLVIDEISMINPVLFDKLDEIARKVRGVDKPFGGIQLVITGDFFQLPPVEKDPANSSVRFCFESKAWKSAIKHTISLAEIYRQRDPKFTSMLNEMREGVVSPATIEIFERLNKPLKRSKKNNIEATELFPLRREAEAANLRRMGKLKGEPITYTAEDGGSIKDATAREKLLKDCIAPKILQLKTGAQVMLVQNLTKWLVNGSQGLVLGFDHPSTFTTSSWENIDPNQDNRDTSFGALDYGLYPVVRFSLMGGGTQVELCQPMEWEIERWLPDPSNKKKWKVDILAKRRQVPLMLAWAISIHKAQGQTMSRVKVDLSRVFETGQSYVALSRAQSLSGLHVVGFDPCKVVAHTKAKKFYASLSKG